MFLPSTLRGIPALGHSRQRPFGVAPYAFQRFQHRYWTHAAVAADYVGAPLVELGGKRLRACAVKTVAVFVDGDLRNQLDLGCYFTRCQNCLMQLLEIPESLQEQ